MDFVFIIFVIQNFFPFLKIGISKFILNIMILFIKGVCSDVNGCPDTLNPVCSDAGIFLNQCLLDRASAALGEGRSLKKLHNGPCIGKNLFKFSYRAIHTLSSLPSESQKQKAELEVVYISNHCQDLVFFLFFVFFFTPCGIKSDPIW